MIYRLALPYRTPLIQLLEPQPALTLASRQTMAEATPLWAAGKIFRLVVPLSETVILSHIESDDIRSLSKYSLRHATFTNVILCLYGGSESGITLNVALRDTNGAKVRATSFCQAYGSNGSSEGA